MPNVYTLQRALSRALRHLSSGTLGDAMLLRNPFLPDPSRVIWDGRQHPAQAARYLAGRARQLTCNGGWALSLGDDGEFHRRLNRWLTLEAVPYRSESLEDVARWTPDETKDVAIAVSGYARARDQTRAVRTLAAHPVLGALPFEFPMGLDPEGATFDHWDQYAATRFVSPVLLDDPSPYELYEESLKHFRQKCGLRDYLDLYQALRSVLQRDVPGDIAEFGSYEGHSGWLLARSLQSLGIRRRVCLFDAFERFPSEPLGIDQSWTDTHRVDFAQVQQRFADFPDVSLVKGDFTRTLGESSLGPVAMAHVDCDSYRATRFLLDDLLGGRLSPGGIVVCEDYGHPALLGHRAAVHDCLTGRRDVMAFFSQFSGVFLLMKQ